MSHVKIDDRASLSYSSVNSPNGQKHTTNVPKIGARHFQALIYFSILTVALAIKSCMSVGVVVMMDPKLNSNPNIPTYPHWTNKNIIMSSFFWAYAFLQPVFGVIVNRYGPKWFMVGGLAVCSLLHATIPQTAAAFGSTGIIIVRVIQGITQSAFYPSVHTLLGQWVPSGERSKLGAFTYSGINVGFVLSMGCTGSLATTKYGWPLLFYVFGGAGFLLSVIAALFIFSSPAVHPSISHAEKFYIESDLGHLDEKPHTKTPWKAIMTSKGFWAIAFVAIGDLYGFWALFNQIPSYMNYIMHFNIKTSSFLLALPYIATAIAIPVFGFVTDFAIEKKWLSIGGARKMANSIALLAPATGLIILANVQFTNPTHVIILLTVSTCINAFSNCGWLINHMDLSPNHAGTMMGLTSGIANTTGFLAPLITNFLVTDETDITQWNRVFYMSAGIYILATVFYDIFGSGTRQPWNEDDYLDKGKLDEQQMSQRTSFIS